MQTCLECISPYPFLHTAINKSTESKPGFSGLGMKTIILDYRNQWLGILNDMV